MVNAFSLVAGTLSLLGLSSGVLAIHEEESTFNLYGYGTGIGGLPVCAWEGGPYIVDFNQVNSNVATPEIVTFTIANGRWLATTNSSSLNNATFSVPGPNANSTNVGFLNGTLPNNTNTIWSGFSFYGHVAGLIDDTTAAYQSSFYALSTDITGMWSLLWNTTDASAIVVTVKDTEPSNASAKRSVREWMSRRKA